MKLNNYNDIIESQRNLEITQKELVPYLIPKYAILDDSVTLDKLSEDTITYINTHGGTGGTVRAIDVQGHKRVSNLLELYQLKDKVLSVSGNNSENDALGQRWYVTDQNAQYILVNWQNRTNRYGWKKHQIDDKFYSVFSTDNRFVVDHSITKNAYILLQTSDEIQYIDIINVEEGEIGHIQVVQKNNKKVIFNIDGRFDMPVKDGESLVVTYFKRNGIVYGYADQYIFYYRYNIRKTYSSISDMNADVSNPIGTDGKYIKIGDIVTVVNSTTPSENGIYSYEGATEGWKHQSSFNFQLSQTTGTDANVAMSQDAVSKEFASVQSDLDQLESNLTDNLSSDLGVNYLPHYIPTGDFSVGDKISYDVVISTSSLSHAILTVKKGDKFVLNAQGGTRPRIYCFVDINDIVLEVSAPAPSTLIEHVITAPADGKLIFNSFNTIPNTDDTVKMGLKVGYSRLVNIENQLLSNSSIVSRIIKNTNPELLLNYGTNIRVTGDVGDVAVIEEGGEVYNFYSNTFEVEEKDIFAISVIGGKKPLAYAILDENGVILEKSGSHVTLIDYLIEIPENGSKLIINSFNSIDGIAFNPSVKVLGSSLLDAFKGQLAMLTLSSTATPPDLTNQGKTLTFGGTVFVFHQNKRYTINSGTVVDLSPLAGISGRMVLLDTKTNDLYISSQTDTLNRVKDHSILIAIVHYNRGQWLMNINCPYTIDGEIYNPFGISYRSFVTLESIIVTTGDYIESDKASMTPMIPSSSLIKATVEDGFIFHRIVLYDNEGAFIGTVLKNSQSIDSSDLADSSFVRLKVVKDDSTAFTPEELELSKPTITRLQQEFFESRNVSDKEIQLYKNGMAVFPVPPSKDDLLTYSFSTNRLLTNYPESNFAGIDTPESDFTHATVKAEDVYTLFDAMVTEHPEYISREQIGLSTNGVPMYVYDFNPTRPSTGIESIKPFPKVILGGAIHGGENMAVYTLYHFFFNMVTNWKNSETLEYLRHSVNFRVIPVQNPEDFSNKKYVGIEEINLNRDFDFRWTESSDTGSTAFQRIESRNLRDFLFENTDALFYTDCHVRGDYSVDDNKLIWVATKGEQIIPASAMIEYLTRKWLIKYPSLQIAKGEFAGCITSELGAKTIRSYTQNVVGIPSFLWEGFQSSTTLNQYQNEDVVNVNLQSLGQYIVSILKYYQSK